MIILIKVENYFLFNYSIDNNSLLFSCSQNRSHWVIEQLLPNVKIQLYNSEIEVCEEYGVPKIYIKTTG
jgi:hypothetical protein